MSMMPHVSFFLLKFLADYGKSLEGTVPCSLSVMPRNNVFRGPSKLFQEYYSYFAEILAIGHNLNRNGLLIFRHHETDKFQQLVRLGLVV